MSDQYRILSSPVRTEIVITRSRFITTLAYTPTIEDARKQIASIKKELSDASHHVYAYRIGYRQTVVEGMSDDGEPSGTSGPPTLAVLRGADAGDILCITTRYFGGTKLGTGGLVRAYTDAVKTALENAVFIMNIPMTLVQYHIPYPWYDSILHYARGQNIEPANQIFEMDAIVTFEVRQDQLKEFVAKILEMTAGRLKPAQPPHPD